ncbi:OmpA family protein [Magnetofaba australis]|uniref:Putative OmpA/MotB domain-containing protein n=1 Tax=Magnetofaba australis IT-1 TaxID=1434232 RepID=A0A1Y2K919_9PROT|nr:OmpA family protein [Magnetofaba australis]OSM05176.1 putative OmpA/MotB domain-containing protein [Magnetofaba australis IT-1]
MKKHLNRALMMAAALAVSGLAANAAQAEGMGAPVAGHHSFGGWEQWHPQVGPTALSAAGTQVYFSMGDDKDSDMDGVFDRLDKCPGTKYGVKVDATGCPMDSDMDGVPDMDDKCPGTPYGAKVNSVGCELDSDGDGVVDSKDKCPGTMYGAKVDAKGCELDDDMDGVVNSKDKCPGTIYGAKVDAKGCELDDDMDGVVNSKDKCPGTPKGAKVDAQGCWKIDGVMFDSDKAVIKSEFAGMLDKVAAMLIRGDLMVEIQGHTDSRASETYNMKLSSKRAQAVMEYLVSKGVSAGKLTAKGYGESNPVASNMNKAGRALNRRVVLDVK